jgi:hypothetical protein
MRLVIVVMAVVTTPILSERSGTRGQLNRDDCKQRKKAIPHVPTPISATDVTTAKCCLYTPMLNAETGPKRDKAIFLQYRLNLNNRFDAPCRESYCPRIDDIESQNDDTHLLLVDCGEK